MANVTSMAEHHEKRLRDPVGKEDPDKQASHAPSLRVASLVALSRGRAKMYPTPRTVLMWSLPLSESPSFLANFADVHVDAAVEGRKLAAEHGIHQVFAGDDASGFTQ